MGYKIVVTDEQLLKATAHARRNAHEAPRNLFRNADGSASLGNSDAWARWSREWFRLAKEVDRRGLAQPPLDYGAPRHDCRDHWKHWMS